MAKGGAMRRDKIEKVTSKGGVNKEGREPWGWIGDEDERGYPCSACC